MCLYIDIRYVTVYRYTLSYCTDIDIHYMSVSRYTLCVYIYIYIDLRYVSVYKEILTWVMVMVTGMAFSADSDSL